MPNWQILSKGLGDGVESYEMAQSPNPKAVAGVQMLLLGSHYFLFPLQLCHPTLSLLPYGLLSVHLHTSFAENDMS